jgi:hypothetical protein
MKPQLPDEIRLTLPMEIVHHIYSFVPHIEKVSPKIPSPSLQKELRRIQFTNLKGKSAMYMRGLEDFCLD